jgi:hypothetical protein
MLQRLVYVDTTGIQRFKSFPHYKIRDVFELLWTRLFCGTYKVPYTLSVKLNDITVWRKTWVKCAVLTGNIAGLKIVLSSRLSHRELRSSLKDSHSFLSLSADTMMASSQCTQLSTSFLAIHSANEHRVIYSFSNITSYTTFYAFFSSFRITLWPMWLANSKRQPCF